MPGPDLCYRCAQVGDHHLRCPNGEHAAKKKRTLLRFWTDGFNRGLLGKDPRTPHNPPYLLGWIRGHMEWVTSGGHLERHTQWTPGGRALDAFRAGLVLCQCRIGRESLMCSDEWGRCHLCGLPVASLPYESTPTPLFEPLKEGGRTSSASPNITVHPIQKIGGPPWLF